MGEDNPFLQLADPFCNGVQVLFFDIKQTVPFVKINVRLELGKMNGRIQFQVPIQGAGRFII